MNQDNEKIIPVYSLWSRIKNQLIIWPISFVLFLPIWGWRSALVNTFFAGCIAVCIFSVIDTLKEAK